MKSAHVQQASALSELFANALAYCRPTSVAILGIAGGNGLEQIDHSLTRRVVSVDINVSYLDEVRERHGQINRLELVCLDLAEQDINVEPVQLVHAALIFEHAGVSRCLENALSLVVPGDSFSSVLQLPSHREQDVSSGEFQPFRV